MRGAALRHLIMCFFVRTVWSLTAPELTCGSGNETKNAPSPHKTTLLLNALLDGYDKRFHPGYYNPDGERTPTTVDVNLNIRSMGPVSETDMAYQMDCYFRQQWTDERLRFTGNDTLRVSVNILERMWKPDTHLFNGQKSYLHVVTTPNKLLRIEPTGTVLYSMRITIKASCPMHLEKFPMDTQTCPIVFGSHGYGMDDILYRWTYGPNRSINMAPDLTLSQFDLIGYPQGTENKTLPMGGTSSFLWANFIFRRHMGYFLINVYVPCSLLVVISWVGFWINREATADRIALGIMTVLNMALMGIDNQRDLPKVSYSTALDIFVAISYSFVLSSILEFAAVHYFTKHNSGDIISYPPDEDDINDVTGDLGVLYLPTEYYDSVQDTVEDDHTGDNIDSGLSNGGAEIRDITEEYNDTMDYTKHRNCWSNCYRCLSGSYKYRDRRIRETSASSANVNSVSRIDIIARVSFPFAFTVFNIIYWTLYLDYGRAEVLL